MRAIQKYRMHIGTLAWILHRLSGLGLIFYLVLHVWVIAHLIGGEESFDGIMEFLSTPLFKFLEIGLVGTILYHLFNGLRITLIDMGVLIERQKLLFGVTVVVWLASWIAIAAVMVSRFGGFPMPLG
jgi:succinate dehydrogenase / fumarate reductase cytochrome b subunit